MADENTNIFNISKSMADENTNKLHIVMFPWLAFGHIIPFLELAKLIAEKGHKISFVSTTRNINRLPKLPPNLSPLIDFVALPLPKLEKLPPGMEATSDVVTDTQAKYLYLAYDGLKQPVTQFLEASSPDWVIFDFASYWVVPICSNFGIPTVYFSIFIAAFLGFIGPVSVLKGTDSHYPKREKPEDFTVPPKWVNFETSVTLHLFEAKTRIKHAVGDEENVSNAFRNGSAIEGCDLLAVRSSYEIEPEWLQLIGKMHNKSVIPVGQLPTTVYTAGVNEDADEWMEMKEWLDKQGKCSVLYVAFGSEVKLSQGVLTEIALGIELSGLPFFWVFRKSGLDDEKPLELPEGFEERTRDRGVVCTGWASQVKILSHDSVGGFLTHSGWSSAVEAVQFERPLILMAFRPDHGVHARILEEKKMGYSIPRDEEDGHFTKDVVAKSLRLVMVEEEGMIYREKSREMKGLFCDKDKQCDYVNKLLECLQRNRQVKKQSP